MANFVYVDVSNLFIEGQRVSAVVKGLAPDIRSAITKQIFDRLWRIDWRKLYEFTGAEPERAYLYGSRTSANAFVWENAEKVGFKPVTYNRSAANREKKVDNRIDCDILEHSYELMRPRADQVIIVTGDGDFTCVTEKLVKRGFNVEVFSWNHTMSSDLKQAASKFVSLDQWLDYLALKQVGSASRKDSSSDHSLNNLHRYRKT
jgi:uncharacterized LabA/DUF88 family protein